MKRIANDVAVATICYVMYGSQKIKIVDYESTYACSNKKNGVVVYDGTVLDSLGYKYTKYFEAKCYGLEVEDDKIVFSVVTKFEQYK